MNGGKASRTGLILSVLLLVGAGAGGVPPRSPEQALAIDDAGLPPDRTAVSQEILHDRGTTRIEVTRASVDGTPFRQPLARALLDGGGNVLLEVRPPAAGPWQDATPTVTESDALALVEASGQPGSHDAASATKIIESTPWRTGPAWLVDPPYDPDSGTNASFVVDAIDGVVRSLGNRASAARVNAYARNPILDPEVRPFALPTLPEGADRLVGPRFEAKNCIADGVGWCRPVTLASPTNDAGDFLFHPPPLSPDAPQAPLDAFAEGSAYFHAERFSAWIDEFGFAGLRCTQRGKRATLVTNYRWVDGDEWTGFRNARYTADCGTLVLLGQTEDADYAYDGDVIAHELGHGVIESQLGGDFLGRPSVRAEAYVNDAGALNEAFADFFSSVYMGDPLVGEYVGQYEQGHTAVRNNANDLRCPEGFNGQVHADSEAFAGALWNIYERFGKVAVPIALDTLALLRENSSVEVAASTFTTVTRATLGLLAADVVEGLFETRGLTKCERIVDVDAMRPGLRVDAANDITPFAPPPLQLRVQVPAWAGSAVIRFAASIDTDALMPEGGIEPGLLVQADRPVRFRYADGGDEIEVGHSADVSFANLRGGAVTVPTDGAALLYLAFVNTGDARMKVDNVSVEFEPDDLGSTGDDTSAGQGDESGIDSSFDADTEGFSDAAGDDDSDKTGCACTSSRHAAPIWMLVGLVGLGLCRHRRRRRHRRR